MKWGRLLLVAGVLLGVAVAAPMDEVVASSNGGSVLRVVPDSKESVIAMREYIDTNELDAWLEPRRVGSPVDIRVTSQQRDGLLDLLKSLGLESKVLIDDVQKVVDEQKMANEDVNRATSAFGWEKYYRVNEIHAWLRSLVWKYPKVASIIKAGRTYEGRNILGIKLQFGQNLPVAFIEAGIHAREWITPAAATFLINEILTTQDESVKKIVQSYEWHIFPSVNPDGYEFTQENRMWRKTRSKTASSSCLGADANRNWPHKWMVSGASNAPCADTFAGTEPASEIETKGLKSYLDAIAHRTLTYISIHSYSQLLMFPWGYTDEHADNHDDMNEVAKVAVDALKKRYKTEFEYGNIAETIYLASGSTVDYAYTKGIKYPYTYELRDTGTHGFLLPPEQIKPTSEETFDSIVALVGEVLKRSTRSVE